MRCPVEPGMTEYVIAVCSYVMPDLIGHLTASSENYF